MVGVQCELVERLTVIELCEFCAIERARIVTMVEHGILMPEGLREVDWAFDTHSIQRAVKAQRLERDLGLNDAGIALVLDLLDERGALLGRLKEASSGG